MRERRVLLDALAIKSGLLLSPVLSKFTAPVNTGLVIAFSNRGGLIRELVVFAYGLMPPRFTQRVSSHDNCFCAAGQQRQAC